jgi:hypothetical protein
MIDNIRLKYLNIFLLNLISEWELMTESNKKQAK